EEGYYAPLIPSSTIIMDIVLVSNDVSVNNHYVPHTIMKAYRWKIQ
ncbi:unnamed protein product, partial [Rotaria sp. Silwood2]